MSLFSPDPVTDPTNTSRDLAAKDAPTCRCDVVVGSREGLHMRPLQLLTELAEPFASEITLGHAGVSANLKGSLMELLMLAAPSGAKMTLVCTGPDAEEACRCLTAAIADPDGLA